MNHTFLPQALEALAQRAGLKLADDDRAALNESAAPMAGIAARLRRPRPPSAEPAHIYRFERLSDDDAQGER